MRNKVRDRSALVRLLENARYEVLPTATTEEKVLSNVPKDLTVTVTASPAKGLETTFELAERLTAEGFPVVPHIAARMVSGKTELEEIVDRLGKAGITRIFVPGGDADPAGDYADSLALLEDLKTIDHPFAQVGITGYPESHPSISDDLTIQAMWDKRKYATHIVSNLSFDPKVIANWVGRLRARGVTLPLLFGMPGPVERAKLLNMATKIGVGESTKFLNKNKGLFLRLAAPGGFTGESFLRDCAGTLGEPSNLVEGLHVFTFNQVAETEAWRQDMLRRLQG